MAETQTDRSVGEKKPRTSGDEGPSVTELSGYNFKRQEFDVEYDNDAEQLLADMEFKDTDTDAEHELKLQVLHIYSKRYTHWSLLFFIPTFVIPEYLHILYNKSWHILCWMCEHFDFVVQVLSLLSMTQSNVLRTSWQAWWEETQEGFHIGKKSTLPWPFWEEPLTRREGRKSALQGLYAVPLKRRTWGTA